MTAPTNPHDAFVKHTFSNLENAAVALRSILPEALSQRIEWQSLRLESGSHVDHLLSDTHTDLLFSTSIAGRRALLYVLFEHQSTADALMPFRLLKYIVRVLDWHVENAKALGHPKKLRTAKALLEGQSTACAMSAVISSAYASSFLRGSRSTEGSAYPNGRNR